MSCFAAQTQDDWCDEDETFDGVIVERRHFLRASLATLAALTGNVWLGASAQESRQPRSAQSWDDVIGRAIPLAERLTEELSPDEEAYLVELSRLMEGWEAIPKAFFDLGRPVATHESLRRFPLWILQFRLAPGAAIPYHDHRDYIGALTVTDGAVRVRSFEILGSDPRPPQGRTFQICETGNAVLTRGAQSTLSRTRDNIHDLRAGPAGARLIDFFTLFREDAKSFYLNVAEQPTDSARRTFDASWAQ
jgi:PCO_ADO